MPYLYAAGLTASNCGTPVLRPMQLEFPDDPAVGYLDRQYMLGAELLVAPVFDPDGWVDFYLPKGTWTSYLTGEQKQGPGWFREQHGYDSLPLYVREGAVLPVGASESRPDYDYLDGLTLEVYPTSATPRRTVTVTNPSGASADFALENSNGGWRLRSDSSADWSARIVGGSTSRAVKGVVELAD
jgi:alpha-D-xyloside xylohydrolase